LFGQVSQEFTGFDAQDFDAFEERKWSNNRFNLERMRVRGKVEALQRAYGHAFERAGVPIQSEVSLDHPTILNNKKVDAIWLTDHALTPASAHSIGRCGAAHRAYSYSNQPGFTRSQSPMRPYASGSSTSTAAARYGKSYGNCPGQLNVGSPASVMRKLTR